MSRGKVIIGMSGGVDSSVSAFLLKKEGYEVIGVSLNLYSCSKVSSGCCSVEDRNTARLTCEHLGIKHFVIDEKSLFKGTVIAPFIEEYLHGRTPSPCILCNHFVKFPVLLREAEKLGAAYIATGHYSRILKKDGRSVLMRGVDPKKDQSYFLYSLGSEILDRTIFPLGELTKTEVRKIAIAEKLPSREKPESQEICFIPDDDYISFVESNAGDRISGAGNFVDMDGKILGRHKGIHSYTIGQRRGLNISSTSRLYVVKIDVEKNEIMLGREHDLECNQMTISNFIWNGFDECDAKAFLVKIRSTHSGESCTIKNIDDATVKVSFNKPVKGVARGQSAVFYDGDMVVGGGLIESGEK